MINIQHYIVSLAIWASFGHYDQPLPLNSDVVQNIVSEWDNENNDTPIMNMALTTGEALDFDGTNDYVALTGYKGVGGTNNRTIEAWIQTSGGTFLPIVSYGENNPGEKWTFRVNNNNSIRLEVNGGFIVGSTNVADNQPHHVAVVFENDGTPDITDAKLYVDGSLETISSSLAKSISTGNLEDVHIGSTPFFSFFFDGKIDEVRIWEKALTQTEIQENMNCELSGTESDLAAYYKFNQGTAGANNAGETTLNDATSNNRDGTLNNFGLSGSTSNWVTPGGVATGTSCVPPGPGAVLDFDGSNDYISVPNHSDFEYADGTVEFWMKHKFTSNLGYDPLLVGILNPSNTRWGVHLSRNLNSIILYNGTSPEFWGFTFSVNTWYHIAVVENGTTVEVFVDGASLGTETYGSGGATGLPFHIGARGASEFFQGHIDEVRLWNSPRTSVEINDNKDCELIGNEANLIAYYSFNQGTAGANNAGETTLNDATSNNRDGTLNNFALSGSTSNWVEPGGVAIGTYCTPPGPAEALDFDGTDDYISASNPPYQAGAFTVEGWYNTNTPTDRSTIFTSFNSDGAAVHVGDQTNGLLRFFVRNPPASNGGVQISSTSNLNDGQWHHFAGVRGTDNKLYLYIDGVLEANSTSTIADLGSIDVPEINIGRNSAGHPYLLDGQLDELRFWDKALSQSEIQAQMNCELLGSENGLVAYYPFNQGTAGATNTGETTLIDASGNGNDATLNNFALSGSSSNWIASGGVTTGTSCCSPTTTISVCSSGCDYATIQDAIDMDCANTIEVQDAIHTEHSITISRGVTIRGSGQNVTTVQAAASRNSGAGRVFLVETTESVIFEDMTIQHGDITGDSDGGGVLVYTGTNSDAVDVTFSRVTLTKNDAGDDGGALGNFNAGTITMIDCTLHDNEAKDTGGGYYETGSNDTELELTNTVFSSNNSGSVGGGMINFASISSTFNNCVFENNTAGGNGAGILYTPDVIGSHLFQNCSFIGNELIGTGLRGGGASLETGGGYTFINCTFSGNTGAFSGAGLYDQSTNNSVNLTNCTFVENITSNFAGGVRLIGGDNYLFNNIIANNIGGTDLYLNEATFTGRANNLVESCDFNVNACPTFALSEDPLLGSLTTCGLQSYYPLSCYSPAIGAGTNVGGAIEDICGNTRSSNPNIGSSEHACVNVCIVEIDTIEISHETCAGALNGEITINATCFDCTNGTSDLEYSIDGTNFQIESTFDSLAPNTYSVYVRNSNETDCSATATLTINAGGADVTPPSPVCNTITAQLDETGNVTLTAEELGEGSFDDCTSSENLTYTITQGETSYTCKDLGNRFNLTLEVTDQEGKTSSCISQIEIAADFHPCAGNTSPNCSTFSSDNVLQGEVFFNFGSASNSINTLTRSNFTVGQPVVGDIVGQELNSGFGFWSRFLLSPSAPTVNASQGDLPDRIQLDWKPDPLSPGASNGYKVFRNGALLATLDNESQSFIDFNVLAGQFYTYEVAGVNSFGEGYRGSALGFVNPNGVVTGRVESATGNPVPGAVVTLTPTLGTALAFDGSSSSFAEYSSVFPRESFTLSCWVKLGDTNDGAGIFDLGSDIGKNWWLHTLPANEGKGVRFCIGRDTGDVTALSHTFTAGTENDWHYIAASYNGEALLFYVDGELIETAVAGIQADTSLLYLGSHSDGTGFYNGHLDEIRFFDQQLPQTEIQMMMNQTVSSNAEGLKSYWKFDEGVGSTAYGLTENRIPLFHCGTAWSDEKPDIVNAGVTDETGFYKIEGINYGSGTIFTATPSKNFYLNQSLEFNGANQNYTDLTDFDLKDTSAITVTLKAFDFSGNQAILSKADTLGNNILVLCLNAGNIDLDLGGQVHTFGSLEMGFHDIAMNLFQEGNSVTAELYKNGISIGNHTFSGLSDDWTGLPWKVGAKVEGLSNHTHYFTGLIDEAVFYDTLLTLPDIQAHASIGTDANHLGLASRFNFNEGSGDIVKDSGPSFTGEGTIHGASWSTVSSKIETLAHEFNPVNRLVTLDPSNTSVDQVDFNDLSTVPVSGYVRYEGTNCFVERAEILVNGQSFSPPIYTDADGKFIADFEPGLSVTLTPVLEDHTFSPAFWELPSLSVPVSGILFQDDTKRTVSGQLAGGHCRKSIIPSNAIVKVKVATLDGCYEKVIQIEDANGMFNLKGLPPDSVTVAVIEHSNPVIYEHFQIQGGSVLDLKMDNDTIDFIYFAPPEVEISPIDSNECGVPVVTMLQKVSNTIKVFETYHGGKCYLDSAQLTINNNIADYSQFDTLMTEGEFVHEYKVGGPNIVPPYAKTFQVTAEVNDELATKTIEAFALGRRERETTFASASPELPTLILRDPPGDGSFAFVETGETTCQSWSFEAATENGLSTEVIMSAGADLETEVGTPFFSTTLEVDVTADLGFVMENSFTNLTSNETESCVTFTQAISTSDDDVIVGSAMGGDVYMGGAMNFVYGITDELLYDTAVCEFLLDNELTVSPDGFKTTFIYTERHIEDIVIPSLQAIDTVSAKQWENIIALNDSLKAAATYSKNLSVSAGVVFEEVEEVSISKAISHSWTQNFSNAFVSAFGVTVNGVGLSSGLEMTWNTEATNENTTTTDSTRTVGYTLTDDDFFDNFTVDVLKDKAYGTPVFVTKSGQTSCPNEPGTQNREEVAITADNQVAVNVNANDAATFELTLGNLANSGDVGFYVLELVPESNLDGAVVKANGEVLNHPIEYQIPLGEPLVVTMSIERGPVAFEYDDIRIAFYSECEYEHAGDLGQTREYLIENLPEFYKELTFDVSFLEPCSEVDIGFPLQDWVLIPSDGDFLNITVNDYDLNDPDLELIRIQYRRTQGDGAWINITDLPKDSLGLVFEIVEWNTQGLQDGGYEIRAVAECNGAQNPGISKVIKGIIERTPPELFGTPEPADGVLSADDEISIMFTEDIRCEDIIQADVFNNNNVGLYNSRTGDLIDATISCSGDKITIVPNVANQFIENQILRVEVDTILDMVGNRFDHTDWEFFVDRNPLRWQAFHLDEIKYLDESKLYVKEIINTGGSSQAYTITDIPNWANIYPTEGFLSPGETQLIYFEFDSTMVQGDFADTIFMDGPEGNEPLPVIFRNICRSPEWELDPSAYTYSMNFSVELNIEGTISEDRMDIVAAFVDGELRGKAYLDYVAALDRYEAFLTVYSNEFIGGTVEFQIWDADECLLYGNVLESFPYEADELVGTPDNPQTLHTSGYLLRDIPLNTGWNWVSFNLEMPNLSLDSALVSLRHPLNDLMKSQTEFANYYESGVNAWIGSLTELNNISMFQYRADEPDTISMVGTPIDVNNVTIPISEGWNWIGYLPQDPMTVDEALASLTALNGDVIKGQTAFAQYVAGFGWLGNLDYMQAPKGYLLRMATSGTLTYPDNFNDINLLEKNGTEGTFKSPWAVNPTDYEHSMILVGMIQKDGENVTLEGQSLGVFANGETRGVAQSMYIEQLDQWLFFLTIYANQSGEPLDFKLYDAFTDETVDLTEDMLFAIDGQEGSVEQPTPFIIEEVLNSLEEGRTEEVLFVQPNPFSQRLHVRFHVKTIDEAIITLTDAMGRIVLRDELDTTVGWNGLDWQTADFAPGMYFVKVQMNGRTMTHKVLAK